MNLKVTTFNIRNQWIGDGINGFIHRQGMVADKIRREKPDVICFQECIPQIAESLKVCLPEYTFIFNGRCKGFTGEGLCIAFLNNTIELCGLECFWLSPTPYIPESKDEESICPRICQRAMLKQKNSENIYNIYNVHLDLTPEIRLIQIKELFERIVDAQQKYEIPFFIMGDFNAEPTEETIRYIINNSNFAIKNLTHNIGYTFHGYNVPDVKLEKIDYIFFSADFEYNYSIEAWKDEIDGIYLSDHYPICATIELQ